MEGTLILKAKHYVTNREDKLIWFAETVIRINQCTVFTTILSFSPMFTFPCEHCGSPRSNRSVCTWPVDTHPKVCREDVVGGDHHVLWGQKLLAPVSIWAIIQVHVELHVSMQMLLKLVLHTHKWKRGEYRTRVYFRDGNVALDAESLWSRLENDHALFSHFMLQKRLFFWQY